MNMAAETKALTTGAGDPKAHLQNPDGRPAAPFHVRPTRGRVSHHLSTPLAKDCSDQKHIATFQRNNLRV